MSIKNLHDDAIEICDLEYDVGGVGSTEASASEENQAANFLVFWRLPDTN